MGIILVGILTVLGVLALVFLILSGLIWTFCWAFGFVFMWKYVFGVWAVLILSKFFFKKN